MVYMNSNNTSNNGITLDGEIRKILNTYEVSNNVRVLVSAALTLTRVRS